jgi:abortive infection bacteriophage resistance protein
MPTAYTKPALSVDDLLTFLERKGLAIGDHAVATNRLRYIGYYRLKIYTRAFEDTSKRFVSGTRFADIIELYEFDRRLRLALLDAIERIEVSLRSALIEVMTAKGGPHFYLDASHFDAAPTPPPGAKPKETGHAVAKKLAAEGNHKSITHYKSTYNSPVEPPIWCLLEASTFGTLSRILSGLTRPNRKEIAAFFALDEKVLVSWARSLGGLRNICAHHQMLWNADFHINAPMIGKVYKAHITDDKTLYARTAVLKLLLDSAYPAGALSWAKSLAEVVDKAKPPWVTTMAYPANWKTSSIWAAAFI